MSQLPYGGRNVYPKHAGAQGLGFVQQLEIKLVCVCVCGAACNVLMSPDLYFMT